MSRWLNVCRNELGNFREKLTLDDIVPENEATQARYSCAIDEPESSSRQCRHK